MAEKNDLNESSNSPDNKKSLKNLWRKKQKPALDSKTIDNDLDKDVNLNKSIMKKKPIYKSGVFIMWMSFLVVIIAVVVSLISTNNINIVQDIFYTGFVNNFFAIPAFLIGIIAFVGNLLQKMKWYNALAGGIKALIGFLILQLGAGVLTGVAGPMMEAFGKLFNATPVYLNPYAGWTNAQNILNFVDQAATIISYTVLIGLAVNITMVALKKWTNCYSINVTGHVMFQQSAMICLFLYFLMFRNISNGAERQLVTALMAGIVVGLYWAVFSNLNINPTNKVTNNAGFAVGHQQMFGVWLAYNVGKLFHRNKTQAPRSADDIKLGKGWSIFHDSIVTSSFILLLFFGSLLIAIYAANKTVFDSMYSNISSVFGVFNGKSFVVKIIGIPLTLVASIQVLIFGVRMFVGELQRSFIGISKRLIADAVIAIDIAGTFAFGTTSILLGFMMGAIGNFLAMAILIAVAIKTNAISYFVLVGFIPMFFDNGALGLYANKSGGLKANLVVPFVGGFLIVFGVLLLTVVSDGAGGSLYANSLLTSPKGQTAYLGMFDWDTLWVGIFGFLRLVTVNAAPYMMILIIGLFVLIAQLTNTNLKVAKKTPLRLYVEEQCRVLKQKYYTKLGRPASQPAPLPAAVSNEQ